MLRPAEQAPASGPTIQRGAAIAERRRAQLASVRYQQPTAELEAYKREHDLRGYKEAAREIGCAATTLQRWVRDGRLTAQRYPGLWAGKTPVLFTAEAIEAGRELLVAAYQGRGERMAAKWADGRITGRPRRGVVNACPICGRLRYRSAAQADKKCCSDRCGQLSRWHITRRGLERFVRKSTGWRGASTKSWLGRLKLLEVRAPHKKGEAAAVEVGGRALEILASLNGKWSPELRRSVIERLMREFEGEGSVWAPDGERRSRRDDPVYRKARARVMRRLRRAFEVLSDPALEKLL